jgi:hypothetical protein
MAFSAVEHAGEQFERVCAAAGTAGVVALRGPGTWRRLGEVFLALVVLRRGGHGGAEPDERGLADAGHR